MGRCKALPLVLLLSSNTQYWHWAATPVLMPDRIELNPIQVYIKVSSIIVNVAYLSRNGTEVLCNILMTPPDQHSSCAGTYVGLIRV